MAEKDAAVVRRSSGFRQSMSNDHKSWMEHLKGISAVKTKSDQRSALENRCMTYDLAAKMVYRKILRCCILCCESHRQAIVALTLFAGQLFFAGQEAST